jgi:hypothetical protein
MCIEHRRPCAAPHGHTEHPQPIDRLAQAMPSGLHRVCRPEESSEFVARQLSASWRAEIQRQPGLKVGLGRETNALGMNLSVAEYSAADG